MLITNCQVEDEKVEDSQEVLMKAIINGENFQVVDNPSNIQAFIYKDSEEVLNFNIRGIDKENKIIEFGIKEFDGVGTYDLKFNLNNQSNWGQIRLPVNDGKDYEEYNTQSAITKNGRGSLKITSVNTKKIEGVFEFFVGVSSTSIEDGFTITNGVFSASLKK